MQGGKRAQHDLLFDTHLLILEYLVFDATRILLRRGPELGAAQFRYAGEVTAEQDTPDGYKLERLPDDVETALNMVDCM